MSTYNIIEAELIESLGYMSLDLVIVDKDYVDTKGIFYKVLGCGIDIEFKEESFSLDNYIYGSGEFGKITIYTTQGFLYSWLSHKEGYVKFFGIIPEIASDLERSGLSKSSLLMGLSSAFTLFKSRTMDLAKDLKADLDSYVSTAIGTIHYADNKELPIAIKTYRSEKDLDTVDLNFDVRVDKDIVVWTVSEYQLDLIKSQDIMCMHIAAYIIDKIRNSEYDFSLSSFHMVSAAINMYERIKNL